MTYELTAEHNGHYKSIYMLGENNGEYEETAKCSKKFPGLSEVDSWQLDILVVPE